MSLYHSLETPPIPDIGQFRPSMMPMEEITLPSNEFAPLPSLKNAQDDDLFIRQRETQAPAVQNPIPVASVPERIYGSGVDTERKRVVTENEDIDSNLRVGTAVTEYLPVPGTPYHFARSGVEYRRI